MGDKEVEEFDAYRGCIQSLWPDEHADMKKGSVGYYEYKIYFPNLLLHKNVSCTWNKQYSVHTSIRKISHPNTHIRYLVETVYSADP